MIRKSPKLTAKQIRGLDCHESPCNVSHCIDGVHGQICRHKASVAVTSRSAATARVDIQRDWLGGKPVGSMKIDFESAVEVNITQMFKNMDEYFGW